MTGGWWTYAPRDFLMFSARTYHRLFALHNQALWPLPLLTHAVGLAALAPLARTGARVARFATGFLAVAWGLVAWSYFVRDYRTIHTFGYWFAAAFALEGALLAGVAARHPARGWRAGSIAPSVGPWLIAFGMLGLPLLGPVLGRPWWQAEWFGSAPDPTVTATFGVLLVRRSPWWLWLLPVVWTAYDGITLWLLRADDALVTPACAALALAARHVSARSASRTP
ncbi:MAG: hypothetical protein HY275_04185 [Gemmatimonadetes bacterium]|nr:hypothetical protein [Gemmatimonadota bacterium]